MLTLETAERYIWWLAIAGYAVLYVRLRREGLHRTYRFFAGYLVFRFVRALGLTAIQNFAPGRFDSDAYAWAWVATEPVLWVLYILIVLELYGLVLQKYPGIASLGRWAIFAGLAIALAIASLTLSADLNSGTGDRFPVLQYALVIGRGVASSLVLFLLFINVFLTLYPVPLSRNVVVHSIVYAIYFLTMTMVLLVRNLLGHSITELVNVIASCVSVLCLGVWTIWLNRSGERQTVRLRQQWRPEHAEHVVEQLSAINSTLMRAARK
jgi:hypothetical protein